MPGGGTTGGGGERGERRRRRDELVWQRRLGGGGAHDQVELGPQPCAARGPVAIFRRFPVPDLRDPILTPLCLSFVWCLRV